VKANTSAACIVGKCWDYHVTEALKTTLDEGVAMVADSVEFLRHAGLRVLFDAEHFFDGYAHNPEFSLRVLEAAAMRGADVLSRTSTRRGRERRRSSSRSSSLDPTSSSCSPEQPRSLSSRVPSSGSPRWPRADIQP